MFYFLGSFFRILWSNGNELVDMTYDDFQANFQAEESLW